MVWNGVSFRAETAPVAYLNDSSLHEQMVRFATLQLQHGQLPLTSWFPYLGLGSPQFLHYQSLPAILAGALGTLTGPNAAFRWTLYVLYSAWPLSVYLAARLFGFGRWAAAASAAMSPFVMSVIGVGYEARAYIWIGYGVWTQLWASMTLPLAWGLSWRAVRTGRGLFAAALLIALTTVLHFETGYLAIIPVLFWPLLARERLGARVVRAGVVLLGALLACAWVIVPLLAQRPWAATNELLQATPLVNGYGAGKMLGWLVSGKLLDYDRLPVLTVLAAIGLIVAVIRWRRDEDSRALVVVFVVCLLLTFGRTTFGALADLLPGSRDIFFRRFTIGVQLAALLLAGGGAAWFGARASQMIRSLAGGGLEMRSRLTQAWIAAAAVIVSLVVLAPAWSQLHGVAGHNADAISAQRVAESVQGTQVDELLAVVHQGGGGRVYAGLPSNWGTSFTVGQVPVFKYLESRDVDEVGYTLRTASLMTDSEFFFDERNPSDYAIFGIRWLVLPAGMRPPVPARQVATSGDYRLWRLAYGGYLHVARVEGAIDADRTNVGLRSRSFLGSDLAAQGIYPAVRYGPGHAVSGVLLAGGQAPPGRVLRESAALAFGRVAGTVRMRAPGTVVLSASFDPGWQATVDGRSVPTRVVEPALVAADVPAGTHVVAFRYVGYGDFAPLFAMSALSLLALLAVDVVVGHRRRRRSAPPG